MNEAKPGQWFAEGGERELELLIDTYGEKMLRYATGILCDYHEAENVVQDVFLTAYRNRASFDGENLSAWLYKITYHRSLNQLKNRRLFVFGEMRQGGVYAAGAERLSDRTLQALRKLKPQERAVLYGRIMEEQSYEQLATLLGESQTALRKRYERAKKKMAVLLAADSVGEEKGNE